MRTTVTIDDGLIKELLFYTRAKTKTSAVTHAVKEQIRIAKLKKLANQLGNIPIDEQQIIEGDKADLERSQWLQNVGGEDNSK